VGACPAGIDLLGATYAVKFYYKKARMALGPNSLGERQPEGHCTCIKGKV